MGWRDVPKLGFSPEAAPVQALAYAPTDPWHTHTQRGHMHTWACRWGVCSQPRSGHTDAQAWQSCARTHHKHSCSSAVHMWVNVQGVRAKHMSQSARVPAAPFQSYQAPAQSFLSPVLQEKNLRDVVGKKSLTISPSSSQAQLSFSRPVRGGERQPLPCSSHLQSERAHRLCLVPQHHRRGPDLPPQLRESFHLRSHPSRAPGGRLASHHGVPKVC